MTRIFNLIFISLFLACCFVSPEDALARPRSMKLCINQERDLVRIKKRCSKKEVQATVSSLTSLLGVTALTSSLSDLSDQVTNQGTALASQGAMLASQETMLANQDTMLTELASRVPIILFARVDISGTLLGGTPGVSSAKTPSTTGLYTVTFQQDVSACTLFTSVAATAVQMIVLSIHVSPRPSGIDPKTVDNTVFTSSADTVINSGFTLLVLC